MRRRRASDGRRRIRRIRDGKLKWTPSGSRCPGRRGRATGFGTTAGLGVAGAASWGAGDFCGGLATRRTAVLPLLMVSQLAGLVVLAAAAITLREPRPAAATLWWGAGVGVAGIAGLIALYRALAIGPMSIVAPVSAVVAAALPIPVSYRLDGAPSPVLVVGFLLGLAGIWLVARGRPDQVNATWPAIRLALVAGLSFGLFYILLHEATLQPSLWPIATARVAAILLLAPIVLRRRSAFPATAPMWTLAILAGLFDSGGNVFFAIVAQMGRLDVAAVLLSLYPAGTGILAFVLLKERLGPPQLLGVAAMAAAVVLMSLV